jgi:hypothetical protein
LSPAADSVYIESSSPALIEATRGMPGMPLSATVAESSGRRLKEWL